MDTNAVTDKEINLSSNPLSLSWPTHEQLEACRTNIKILTDAKDRAEKDPDYMVIVNPDDVPLLLASILNVGLDLGRQKVLLELMVQGYRFNTA